MKKLSSLLAVLALASCSQEPLSRSASADISSTSARVDGLIEVVYRLTVLCGDARGFGPSALSVSFYQSEPADRSDADVVEVENCYGQDSCETNYWKLTAIGSEIVWCPPMSIGDEWVHRGSALLDAVPDRIDVSFC